MGKGTEGVKNNLPGRLSVRFRIETRARSDRSKRNYAARRTIAATSDGERGEPDGQHSVHNAVTLHSEDAAKQEAMRCHQMSSFTTVQSQNGCLALIARLAYVKFFRLDVCAIVFFQF